MNGNTFIATQSMVVGAEPAQVWEMLTKPAKLSEWFAENDSFGFQQPFTFAFGDGDFFAGQVKRWEAPHCLGFEWQFMGLGPAFRIELELTPADGGTLVSVTDEGSLSAEEALSLEEGWLDFLQRLRNYAATGAYSRYLWSQEMSVTISLGEKQPEMPAQQLPPAWWQRHFAQAAVKLESSAPTAAVWRLREDGWPEETVVNAALSQHSERWYLTVNHSAWEAALPLEQAITSRRNYANLWVPALASLEQAAAV